LQRARIFARTCAPNGPRARRAEPAFACDWSASRRTCQNPAPRDIADVLEAAAPIRSPAMSQPVRRKRPAAKAVAKRPSRKSATRPKARGQRVVLVGGSRAARRRSAHGLADDLGGSFLAIDLSRVVSPYVGETEKNLARIFELAEATNAVLLFDEADALFGKRTSVKDSHDRYANLEVSYLLQRIESHAGPVLLASNKRGNLDDPFLRRLRFRAQSVRGR